MTNREEREPMHCPYDGTELNQHANIIRDPIDDADQVDPALGGVPIEAHSCPICGRGQIRSPSAESYLNCSK